MRKLFSFERRLRSNNPYFSLGFGQHGTFGYLRRGLSLEGWAHPKNWMLGAAVDRNGITISALPLTIGVQW